MIFLVQITRCFIVKIKHCNKIRPATPFVAGCA